MIAPALENLLAAPEQVAFARASSEDFKAFLALAQKSSGEPLNAANLAAARYRIVDARLGSRDDLTLDSIVTCWGLPIRIEELLAGIATVDRVQLIHSLWRLETFEDIKQWLKALRVTVRLVYGVEGHLHGHLLLAETIIPMVETVERKDYVLPNGDMASDAITRNLGIRAKVFALDRLRRTPRVQPSNSIMDRLSRTLSKINR